MARSRFLIAAGTAAAVVASFIVVTAVDAAHADEDLTLGPDPVTSLDVGLCYGATGRLKLTPPSFVVQPFTELPGWTEEQEMWAYQEWLAKKESEKQWNRILNDMAEEIRKEYPDTPAYHGDKEDPMFANWKYANGSEAVEPAGRASSTEVNGNKFDVKGDGKGGVRGDYRATAVVRGANTDITGSYGFQLEAPGYARGNGSMRIDAYTLFGPEEGKLKLSGFANVIGADTYVASVAPTSMSIGMTGTTAGGDQVGVSVAVGPNGDVIGISFGGTVVINGLPAPIQIRIDVNASNVNFTASPANGITITQSSNGVFRVNVDVNVFYKYLQSIVTP